MNPALVLGLTMGDPAGVGPELCLRVLAEGPDAARCVPVVFGDAAILGRVAQAAGLPGLTCRVLSLPQWEQYRAPREPVVVDCATLDAGSVEPGRVAAACGKAGAAYIEHAIAAALSGRVAGVVTAPIHKEAWNLAGVPYPGHTEMFTALTHARRSCMLLYSEALTVSMVTTHIGYSDVPARLSVERVRNVIELTDEAMRWLLGRAPRLAICGLNPHGGEHGLFGHREEERFLEPALAQVRQNGIPIEGPLPPDAAFTSNQRRRFDAIVTLYHDQGHIPFKMVAFDTGVNTTLGLPIIRTSVDHGTAFDIAWKGVASPESLQAAIRVASRLAQGRGEVARSAAG